MGVKGKKLAQNKKIITSVTDHMSATVRHLIIFFDTLLQNDICRWFFFFFHFFEVFIFRAVKVGGGVGDKKAKISPK